MIEKNSIQKQTLEDFRKRTHRLCRRTRLEFRLIFFDDKTLLVKSIREFIILIKQPNNRKLLILYVEEGTVEYQLTIVEDRAPYPNILSIDL